MITREREKTTSGSGDGRPPREPGGGNGWPWWRSWPSPPNRPRPINRRSFWLGAAVALPALLLLDGLLGVMAAYASGRILVGVAVGAGMLVFTCLELMLVAWVTKRRQELEQRRARRQEG